MKKAVMVVVLVLVLVHVARIVQDAGVFRSVEPAVGTENCEMLVGPVGAEDITIDPVTGIAYISADDRRDVFNNPSMGAYPNGAIWRLDMKQENSQPERIELDLFGEFHPHGIALRFSEPDSNDKGRAIELYVVNHISAVDHEIVVFTILETGELKLRRRITYPELLSPNDLVVVDKDQFYVSNDHSASMMTKIAMLEDYLGLPLASVSYFDGVQGHIVIDGLRFTNGLALSKDKKQLYVAETTAGRIARYINLGSPLEWKLDERLNVDLGVDNFEWDAQGYLLNAGHPKLFAFQAHKKDPEALSPSKVIRINVDTRPMQVETVFLDQGELLSGASGAAKWQDKLLVGSVFESHFLRCSVP